MRIGFLSDSYNDPERVSSWSGLPYFFAQKMRNAGCEVVPIRGRNVLDSISEKVKQAAWMAAGKRYVRGLNAGVLRAYARSVEPLLQSQRIDAVFTVNSWLLAHLETDLPTAFWTDATFASMLGFYDSFSNLASPSIAAGHETERRALDRCDLAIYSSRWAAQSAEQVYGADPERILIAPFGANLEPMPSPAQAKASVVAKTGAAGRETCELLCIAVDWKRKGLDLAVETVGELQRRGIKTRLRIAGCQPPSGARLPANVEVLGFINKNSAEGQQRLQRLYQESHFFILPSRAEAFGVVMSEAAAFGVPCLCTNVGGLPDVVQPEKTGQLFGLEAAAPDYADWIEGVWSDPDLYRVIALGALENYHDRLCGQKAANRAVERLRTLAGASTRRESAAPVLQEVR